MREPDVVELAGIKYRILNLLPISSFFAVCTLLVYLATRIFHLVQVYNTEIDKLDVVNSILYLVTELGIFLPGFLTHFLRCLAFQGRNKAPHLRLLGDNDLPRIDVFITCAGEDIDTVRNTIAAACALDYPKEFFRVIVLDDGGSEDLSEAVHKMSNREKNLMYTARVKGEDHHFKAGNLNHGLDFVRSLPEGPGEYVAALDADMIADPQFLRALLPHLLRNPKSALAQLPQLLTLGKRFYDVPSDDPLLQGLDINFKVTEPLKETMGSTWCGGSGYILRRQALDSIGGYPTDSVGEDMYCSNVLLGKGWDAIYVDECLQTGRVPESYKAHVKQQTRWHVGRVQTAKAMRFYLYGEHSRKMNLRQRLVGIIYVMVSFLNILTTAGMATLLLTLASGRPLIVYRNHKDLYTLVQLISAAVFTEWLDDFIGGLITGYRIAVSEGHVNFWIAPYHAAGLLRALAPRWLQKSKFEFTASGSGGKKDNDESDNQVRGYLNGWWKKLQTSNVGLHSLYVVLLGLALARQTSQVILEATIDGSPSSFLEKMVTHVFWPPSIWLILLNSFAIPIRCAFAPMSIPNRSELLKKDPVRRASYPKETSDSARGGLVEGLFVVYTGIVAYTAVLGICGFLFA